MSKKTQIFTNIEDFVREKYPEVANLFDYCHLFNIVHPRPGSGGIALLVPKDEKYLAEIKALSASDDPEKVGRACDALLSFVIRGDLGEPANWTAESIGNSKYPMQRIIGVPHGNTVELQHKGKTYAKIERDKAFRPGYRKNISVWVITEGRMYDGPDAEILRRQGSPRKKMSDKKGEGISGGYKVSEKNISQIRFKVALSAENEFLVQRQMPRNISLTRQSIIQMPTGESSSSITTQEGQPLSPFQSYVIAFARYLHHTDKNLFYGAVLPLIRFRVTDFYFIFEPHRFPDSGDGFLIPDEVIESWWETFQTITAFPQNLLEFRSWVSRKLEKAAKRDTTAAIYKCSDADTSLCEAIDATRSAILGNMQAFPQLVANVKRAYDELCKDNAIGGVANVFPAYLAGYYKAHPGFKQAQDELAFVIEPIFSQLGFGISFNQESYKTAINMLGNLLHAKSAEEIQDKLPLMNTRRATFFDQIKDSLHAFVNSTMFLWIPIHEHVMKNYPIESTAQLSAISPDKLFNADLALNLEHERLYNDAKIANQQQNIALYVLDSIKTKMTPELRAKIETIAKK